MPRIRSTLRCLRIGGKLTESGRAIERERLESIRSAESKQRYRPVSLDNLPYYGTHRKEYVMPAVKTITTVVNLASAKRGRKAKDNSAILPLYVTAEGSYCDITEDLTEATDMEWSDLLAAVNDRTLFSDDQRKAFDSALAAARLLYAEANNHDRTDSGGFSVANATLATFPENRLDESGEEVLDDDGVAIVDTFLGLHTTS